MSCAVRTLALILAVCTGLACQPRRLREVSQKEDKRSEQQIRAERLRQEGERLLDAGDPDGARQKFLASLREHADQFEAHDRLGQVYEIAGRPLEAWVEFAASIELLRSSRHRVDRMLPYVVARYGRDPDLIREIQPEQKAKAMLALSEALLAIEAGRQAEALRLIDSARPGMPGAGVCDYLAGHVRLRAGDLAGARESFCRGAEENGYIVRRVLSDKVEEKIPDLLPALAEILRAELAAHPSDLETALMLAVVRLRLAQPQDALDAIGRAQAWSPPRWDLLSLKAAALERLGQKSRADQALADLRGVRPDISLAFSEYEPSLFFGPLNRSLDAFFLERIAPSLPEPASSYLAWMLLREAGDERADAARKVFYDRLRTQFPDESFENAALARPPEEKPQGYEEYLGLAQQRIEAVLPAVRRCDLARRSARPNPSANLTFRLKLRQDGTVGAAGVDDESLGDPWVIYCAAGHLMPLSFARSPRGPEVLRLPLLFGPEADVPAGDKP